MVFSTFHMNQLVKIHQHCCKELLYISKVATFESDKMKTNTKKLQNFIDVCMVGGGGGKFVPLPYKHL